MKILITYDVSTRQPEVKQGLLDVGFKDRWRENNIVHYMPDTTLWHPDLPSPERENEIFHEVIDELNIGQTLENVIIVKRFFAVEYNTWSGAEG